MEISIVGGGVIGLSCAVRLGEAGHEVVVISPVPPEDTTSMVAGGLVYPRLAEPLDRCAAWTSASVARYLELAARPGTGVRLLPGRLLRRAHRPVPIWADAVGGIARDTDIGPPWVDALAFSPPLVDTAVYLPWLAAEATRRGARLETRTVRSLDEFRDGADLVVNAAGLGGGPLAGDSSVRPARGQVVHIADPGLAEWIVDEDDFSYVLPHGRYAICGGTEEPGRSDLTPEGATTTDILRRCAKLVPAVAGAEVLRVRVGLRPTRPQVRVEREADVIHCYGHGGSGITLAWGCADDVAQLAV